jgi:outer membrane protein assembly factor BamA
MKIRQYVYIIYSIILFTGCSNTRFLTDEQLLYTGRGDIEINNPQGLKNVGEVKSYVKSITASKVNNSVLGLRALPPVSLWIYNYAKPKKDKGFGNWLYRTFSKPPILVSDVNPELRSAKIQNELNNSGYFHSTASDSIYTRKYNPKKAKVSYKVDLYPPWHINRIIFDSATQSIDSLIQATDLLDVIEPGDRFDLASLKSLKTRIAGNLQENGYFFFVPEYISISADSGIGNSKVDLFLKKNESVGEDVLSRYRINEITMQITRAGGRDSILTDTLQYMDMVIISPGTVIKPMILYNSVAFGTGDIYSLSSYRKTLSNLDNLGIFTLVTINFEAPDEDSALHLLNVRIEALVPHSVSLSVESNLVTKSTGFTGPAIIAGIQHKNAFKGAEKLELTLTGNMEWQWYKNYSSELGSYSYEAGTNAGLVFPRIMLPGGIKNKSELVTRSTSINGGFSLLNRTAFYRLNALRASLSYQWGRSEKIQHTFYPFYLNSIKLVKTTPEFDSVINSNIYIRRSFEEQFILGFRYEFTYDNKTSEKPGNFLFMGGAYTSGNLISLFSSKPDDINGEPGTFLNSVYAQFAKFTSDLRYYLTGNNQTLAFRLYAGIGLPYGNSSVLPYVEQFFSGGAYSIRGFPARRLGPGSFYDGSQGYIDQSGDIRLELNLEYRIKFTKLLNGALFLETGNVWLRNDDPERPGAQFKSDTFISQLAIGTGLGLRFDLGFFVLRTDLGLPLRTPYYNNGSQRVGGLRDMIKSSVFHLAIGYPF